MEELAMWQSQLSDFVSVLEINRDGSRIIAGSLAGDALLLDHDGETITKLNNHAMGVLSAAWSPDGSRFAVGGQDNNVHLYDADGQPLRSIAGDRWITRLRWAPDSALLGVADGQRLVLVSSDGDVAHKYQPVASTITDVAWSDSGTRVGVTAYGGVTWYDPARLPDDAPSRTHTFKGSALSLALSPNGRWACAGFQDSSIHLWRLWSGDDLSMSGFQSKVEHLRFKHDSHWMAASCRRGLTVWDFSGSGPRGTSPALGDAHTDDITCMSWEPNGDRLVTGGNDSMLIVWPTPTSLTRPLLPMSTTATHANIATLDWHPKADSLVVGYADGRVERRLPG